MSLEKAGLEELGTAKRVVITKENSTIIDGAGSSDDIAVVLSKSALKSKRLLRLRP